MCSECSRGAWNVEIANNLRPERKCWKGYCNCGDPSCIWADQPKAPPSEQERRWLEEHVQYLLPPHSDLNQRLLDMDVRKQPDPVVISDSAFIAGIVLAGLSIVAVLVWVLR